MRLPILKDSQVVRYRGQLLLASAIVLFGFLTSIAAPPVLSLFIIRESKLIPSEADSEPANSEPATMQREGYSTKHNYIISSRDRSKIAGKGSRVIDLNDEIEKQRSNLDRLESEAKKKRTLELMGETNLLLMLNTKVINHLNFFNKWLNSPPDDSSETESTESIDNFTQSGKMALNVSLLAPNVINLAQTAKIEVSVDWTFPDGQAVPKKLPVIEPKLDSTDFKIAGKPEVPTLPLLNSGTKQQTWVWLISAEKIGDRNIVLSFKSADNHAVAISIDKETKVYEVLIPITVLTELGLSSTQNAWATAIGAILGIIGTIAGYGFWKYRKAKKNNPKALSDNEDEIDAAAVTQAVELILRAIARHLKEHEAGTQSKEKEKPKIVEGTAD